MLDEKNNVLGPFMTNQGGATKPERSLLRTVLTTAAAMAGLSVICTLLNMRSWDSGGYTIIWLPNAFLLGILLCTNKRRWIPYIIAGFIVDICLNLTQHPAAWISDACVSCCNSLEAVLPAFLLYPVVQPTPDLTERRQFRAFLLYGVIVAPAIASFLAACMGSQSCRMSLPSLPDFLTWYAGDALGIATLTPLYVTLRGRRPFRGFSPTAVAVLLASLLLGTAAVFWQSRYPLLFLVLVALMLVGVRLGLAGSALGLLLVCIVGGFLTTLNHGPLLLVQKSSLGERDLVFQLFILLSMILLYVTEIVTGERARFRAHLEESERRFRQLAETASDAIILEDRFGTRTYVSAAFSALLGWTREEALTLTYRDVHPEDLSLVEEHYLNCWKGKAKGSIECRGRKVDGGFCWLELTPRLYFEEEGSEAVGVVTVARDISQRKADQEVQRRAFEMIEQMAKSDVLTGVANRRHFDLAIEREWLRAQSDDGTLALLMIDVDNFKLFNDNYGHQCGDECLKRVATVANKVISRSGDLLARYGGEEFAVILPGTDLERAYKVAERIRSAVEQLNMVHTENSPTHIVTLSIGCAAMRPRNYINYDELVRSADQSLYRAKRQGRNRTEIHQELWQLSTPTEQ